MRQLCYQPCNGEREEGLDSFVITKLYQCETQCRMYGPISLYSSEGERKVKPKRKTWGSVEISCPLRVFCVSVIDVQLKCLSSGVGVGGVEYKYCSK